MTSESAMKLQSATETPSAVGGGAVTPSAAPARTGAARDARFHIFVIDSGWNCAASKVLREHLDMISDLHIDDELYVLDRATSIALLRHYPLQVGRDPIIAVHDLRPRRHHRVTHTPGFRMHLGILDSEEQVLGITHRDAADIDQLVRQDLHRKGFAGAIEILGGHEHTKMIE
jgi:hypothetical protein